MKKLLSILAAASFIVSTTSTTVVSCAVKSSGINSLHYKWDLGEMDVVNQQTIIKRLAEVNGVTKENYEQKQDDVAALASMYFDKSTIKLGGLTLLDTRDGKQSYVATMSASKNSKVLKGKTEVTFKATEEAVEKAKNPIVQENANLTGTWWNWGSAVNDKELKGSDAKLADLASKGEGIYDSINISSTFTKAGKYEIDSIAMNNFTLKPEGNPDFDNVNSQFLLDRKNGKLENYESKMKFTTSLGGATADRMVWKWKQKDALKDKLKEILCGFGLDGLDLAIAGETLYNRESQETLSQAIKEIMVEYWLENKDFDLGISSRMHWLFKDGVEKNRPTTIPFFESLDGWYKDITLLMYNVTRASNFAIAQEDIKINGDLKIKKGDKVRATRTPAVESPEYFYGTLRNMIDKEWNKNSRFYDLSDKPIRISAASQYSVNTGALGFEGNEPTEGEKSNWQIALEQLEKDAPAAFKNIIGFNYFGVNIDQIMSNTDPSKPTKWDYSDSLAKYLEEIRNNSKK